MVENETQSLAKSQEQVSDFGYLVRMGGLRKIPPAIGLAIAISCLYLLGRVIHYMRYSVLRVDYRDMGLTFEDYVLASWSSIAFIAACLIGLALAIPNKLATEGPQEFKFGLKEWINTGLFFPLLYLVLVGALYYATPLGLSLYTLMPALGAVLLVMWHTVHFLRSPKFTARKKHLAMMDLSILLGFLFFYCLSIVASGFIGEKLGMDDSRVETSRLDPVELTLHEEALAHYERFDLDISDGVLSGVRQIRHINDFWYVCRLSDPANNVDYMLLKIPDADVRVAHTPMK